MSHFEKDDQIIGMLPQFELKKTDILKPVKILNRTL